MLLIMLSFLRIKWSLCFSDYLVLCQDMYLPAVSSVLERDEPQTPDYALTQAPVLTPQHSGIARERSSSLLPS